MYGVACPWNIQDRGLYRPVRAQRCRGSPGDGGEGTKGGSLTERSDAIRCGAPGLVGSIPTVNGGLYGAV